MKAISAGILLLSSALGAQEKWVRLREIPAIPTALSFRGNSGYVVCRNSAPDSVSESVVLHTPDGGTTWSSAKLPGRLYAVQAAGERVAYLAGDQGRIYKTLDAGSTWTRLPTPASGEDIGFLGMHFRDAENGFVTGFALMLNTGDGGATWGRLTAATHPVLAPQLIESILFPETRFGFAAGNGTILRSRDGGATWRRPDPLPHHPLYVVSMHFLDARSGFATGHAFRDDPGHRVAGRVYGTRDSGETWSILRESPARGDFPEKLWFTSALTGYGLSRQAFLKTADGGATWHILDRDPGLPFDSGPIRPHDGMGLAFTEEGAGYAFRPSGVPGSATPVYHVWKLTGTPMGPWRPPFRQPAWEWPFPSFVRGTERFDLSGRWLGLRPPGGRPPR